MLKSIKAMFMKPKWIFIAFGLVNCAIMSCYFLSSGLPDWGIVQLVVAIMAGPLAIVFGLIGLSR